MATDTPRPVRDCHCACHYPNPYTELRDDDCPHRDRDGGHRRWEERDLVDRLRERYTSDAIPPCAVCGAELGIASVGGGKLTMWACTSEDAKLSIYRPKEAEHADHYRRSYFQESRHGDSTVIELLDRIDAARDAFADGEWDDQHAALKALLVPGR